MTHAPQFSIALDGEDFAEKIPFAEKHHVGVEIDAFFAGPALFDQAARNKTERELGAALRDFPYRRSLHGAFIDLAVHSADPAVCAVARDRILRDLETASRLGCSLVVFHTGFNPLVPGERYGQEFLERHAAFWPGVADRFPGLTIGLENMWEASPGILEQLFPRIHHPRVGLCLDVAHAHAYSPCAMGRWLTALQPWIVHMHWNDNHGDTDSHLPIGQGTVPWQKVQAFTRRLPGITVVVELKSMRFIRQSLRYLARFGLPPRIN